MKIIFLMRGFQCIKPIFLSIFIHFIASEENTVKQPRILQRAKKGKSYCQEVQAPLSPAKTLKRTINIEVVVVKSYETHFFKFTNFTIGSARL